MSKEADFSRLIDGNRGIIIKVIHLYVDDREDAKDVFQEVVYQAWRSYPQFRGDSKFSTWLYRIALNTVLTFRRRTYRTGTFFPLTSYDVLVPVHDENGQIEALYIAIKLLSPIDRMIITLHLDGYDNTEIAEISGLTRNNINVKLHRIKSSLIKQLT